MRAAASPGESHAHARCTGGHDLLVYFVVLIVIGVWVWRRTQTLGDFLLGGRGLNSPTAALSAQASDMSGWLLLGFPGAVYAAGIGASWIAIGLAIGTYLNWKFVAPGCAPTPSGRTMR